MFDRIAVMDAKYYYNFWRPITAICNGDIDSNPATERDPPGNRSITHRCIPSTLARIAL
jgi:hypothetical protein